MRFGLILIYIALSYSFNSALSLTIIPRRMFAALGQFASSSQFYLFGRNRCTRTGWEKASRAYPKPDILEKGRESVLDLSDKVFMITGANGGIGFEIADFLALKKATVYMVCRSAERGQAAKDAIVTVSQNNKVHLLVGDCGLEEDVHRVWNEFVAHRASTSGKVQLDALICNAGALLNELTLTSEEVETTFAAHLLFGTYLLGSLALPTLKNTPHSRLLVVSSGGMYNSKFPAWDVATSTGNAKYDGQFAYVYAKRGQVLLCEQWAAEHGDSVKIASCHPGWVDTGGVDKAYGENKKYLEPLRSLWEGAEGILWLCVCPAEQIQNGAFYLDRTPQVKHLAGPFFTEGSFTKNTPEEVADMMTRLKQWSDRSTRPTRAACLIEAAKKVPLVATSKPIELASFMGNWHVLANIPTSMETGAANCIEMYELDPARANTVKVTFQYSFATANKINSFSTSQMHMRGNVKNTTTNTQWSIDPKMLGLAVPLGMSYLILDAADDYSYTLVSVPDRSYMWIMIRATPSEFPPANVRVVDAYPELHMDGFHSRVHAPAHEQRKVQESLLTTPPTTTTSTTSTATTTTTTSTTTSPNTTNTTTTTTTTTAAKHSPVEPEVQAAATITDHALAHAGAVEHSTQAAKRHYEIRVLRRALAKASELGFDVHKILRVPWFVALEKERELQQQQQQQQQQQPQLAAHKDSGSGEKTEKAEKEVLKEDHTTEKSVSFGLDNVKDCIDADTKVDHEKEATK